MKNNNLKISVVIPVLNGAKTLEQCLFSIIKQDYPNYEIIIVDNGSTDKTKDIIDRFIKISDKIIYIFESKRGRGSARNTGIALASGEIIAMTDADCLVPSGWLSSLTKPICEEGELVVFGFEKDAVLNYWSKIRQAEDWRSINMALEGNYANRLDTKNFAAEALLLKKFAFHSQLLTNEDWDLFIRLKLAGIKVRFLPELLVSHYHDASFRELVATQFLRGKTAALTIGFYRDNSEFKKMFKNDENIKSFRLRNFIFFIPWVLAKLIFSPFQAPYLIVADLAWKIGGLTISKFKRII